MREMGCLIYGPRPDRGLTVNLYCGDTEYLFYSTVTRNHYISAACFADKMLIAG